MDPVRNDDFSDPKVFEYWCNLAETDPERFESERLALLESVISSDSQRQLQLGRSLQRKIDGELSEQSNFDGRMSHAFKMMANQFNDEKNGFKSIQGHFLEALEEAIDAKLILSEEQARVQGLLPQMNTELLRIMKNEDLKPD